MTQRSGEILGALCTSGDMMAVLSALPSDPQTQTPLAKEANRKPQRPAASELTSWEPGGPGGACRWEKAGGRGDLALFTLWTSLFLGLYVFIHMSGSSHSQKKLKSQRGCWFWTRPPQTS